MKKVKAQKTVNQDKQPITHSPIIALGCLERPEGARRRKKLLGRGPSSGHGKTSTRGTKGQTSRAGRHFYIGFEGGSLPLVRKIPKRGFSRKRLKKVYQIVNLEKIAKLNQREIDPPLLEKEGLIKDKNKLVKILGEGEISQAIFIKAHAFSKTAQEKIEAKGGRIQIIHDQCIKKSI